MAGLGWAIFFFFGGGGNLKEHLKKCFLGGRGRGGAEIKTVCQMMK